MNLRFLEKKDGKKILQHWNGEWKDIPVEKELSLVDKICSLVFDFERQYKKRPSGIMLGCKEFAELNDKAAEDWMIGKKWGNRQTLIMNVPVYELKERVSTISLLVEAQ